MSARSEAMARGDKRYRSSTPCPRGHESERFVSSGRCIVCAVAQTALRWETNRQSVLESATKSRIKHRAKNLPKRRALYAADLEKSRAKGREESLKYRTTKKAQLKAAKRKHYLARMEHIQERNRRTYQENKETRRTASRVWAKANQDKVNAACHAYRARKRNAGGRFYPADIARIFALQKGKCAYCRTDLKRTKRHIDHITALVNGGSNDPSNIQLLCRSCNTSKQHRDPIYHARTLGMLL